MNHLDALCLKRLKQLPCDCCSQHQPHQELASMQDILTSAAGQQEQGRRGGGAPGGGGGGEEETGGKEGLVLQTISRGYDREYDSDNVNLAIMQHITAKFQMPSRCSSYTSISGTTTPSRSVRQNQEEEGEMMQMLLFLGRNRGS